MQKIKKYFYFLGLIIILAACSNKQNSNKNTGDSYNIYYLNSTATSIVSVEYKTDTRDKNLLINELMYEMNKVPRDKDMIKVLEDKVGFNSYTIKGNIIYLNFDNNYGEMKPTREILARACLVKTLTQISGIEFVGINLGEKPLSDENGNPLPIFYATEFVDTISNINNFEKVELSLYFANEKGDKLKEEKRILLHDVNNSMEKLVIEELIKGPRDEKSSPLLPVNLKLNSVSINENTCYLDFSDSLINVLNQSNNRLIIYSISNSITLLGNASKVQISINGKNNYKFINDVDLSKTFDRNLDYIEEKK